MFSIVIPLYNKEKQIAKTLESVFNQTFQEYEIVVVNDGSTDNSVEIVKQIDDKRIKLINQPNGGVSSARNTGIKNASFEYIAFLDADDFWMNDYLETIFNMINQYPSCDVFATKYFIKTIKKEFLPKIALDKNFEGIIADYFYISSISDPLLWTSAIVATKKSLLKIKGFPLNVKGGEDLLTWARLAVNYEIAFLNTPKATFIRDLDIPNERRNVDISNIIGEELEKLQNDKKNIKTKNLDKYIIYWYFIRVSLLLRAGLSDEAKIAVKKLSEYNVSNLKYKIFKFIAYSPKFMCASLYETYNKLKNIFKYLKGNK